MGRSFNFDSIPCLIRSLIVDNGFFVIFEIEAKLSMGLDAGPTSHVPNLSSRR